MSMHSSKSRLKHKTRNDTIPSLFPIPPSHLAVANARARGPCRDCTKESSDPLDAYSSASSASRKKLAQGETPNQTGGTYIKNYYPRIMSDSLRMERSFAYTNSSPPYQLPANKCFYSRAMEFHKRRIFSPRLGLSHVNLISTTMHNW